MNLRASPLSVEGWLNDMFSSKSACAGGVVRRKSRDIEKFVGRQTVEAELPCRGYRDVENAGQIIVFCNREPVHPVGEPFSFKENDPEFSEKSGSAPYATDAR